VCLPYYSLLPIKSVTPLEGGQPKLAARSMGSSVLEIGKSSRGGRLQKQHSTTTNTTKSITGCTQKNVNPRASSLAGCPRPHLPSLGYAKGSGPLAEVCEDVHRLHCCCLPLSGNFNKNTLIKSLFREVRPRSMARNALKE